MLFWIILILSNFLFVSLSKEKRVSVVNDNHLVNQLASNKLRKIFEDRRNNCNLDQLALCGCPPGYAFVVSYDYSFMAIRAYCQQIYADPNPALVEYCGAEISSAYSLCLGPDKLFLPECDQVGTFIFNNITSLNSNIYSYVYYNGAVLALYRSGERDYPAPSNLCSAPDFIPGCYSNILNGSGDMLTESMMLPYFNEKVVKPEPAILSKQKYPCNGLYDACSCPEGFTFVYNSHLKQAYCQQVCFLEGSECVFCPSMPTPKSNNQVVPRECFYGNGYAMCLGQLQLGLPGCTLLGNALLNSTCSPSTTSIPFGVLYYLYYQGNSYCAAGQQRLVQFDAGGFASPNCQSPAITECVFVGPPGYLNNLNIPPFPNIPGLFSTGACNYTPTLKYCGIFERSH